MSNHRKAQRREKKRQVREEGRLAFKAGRHVKTNPYYGASATDW